MFSIAQTGKERKKKIENINYHECTFFSHKKKYFITSTFSLLVWMDSFFENIRESGSRILLKVF